MNVEHAPGGSAVTVVIPVWGSYVKTFLARAVASALKQDLEPEVLVVDNGNAPGTVFPEGVRVVRSEEQLTVGASRNLAVPFVKTDYVLFLDADDELRPGALRTLRAGFEDQPATVAVAARMVDRRTGGEYHWPRAWAYHFAAHRVLFAVAECCRPCIPLQTTLMRADTLRDSPMYSATDCSAEDWPLGVSLVLRGRITFVDEPALVYTPNKDGLWSRVSDAQGEMRSQAEVRTRLREEPALAPWARWLVNLLAVAHGLDRLRWRVMRRQPR